MEWKWRDGSTFIPTTFPFDRAACGICDPSINDSSIERDFFQLFFTEEIMGIITEETNKFFGFNVACRVLLSNSRFLHWYPPTVREMYSFLALVILMGLNPKDNYKYWSTDPLHHMPVFSKVMSVNRFIALLQSRHFQDNTIPTDNDRMRKIRPVFRYICNRFKATFTPFQKMVIDESLVLWRGNLYFHKYI